MTHSAAAKPSALQAFVSLPNRHGRLQVQVPSDALVGDLCDAVVQELQRQSRRHHHARTALRDACDSLDGRSGSPSEDGCDTIRHVFSTARNGGISLRAESGSFLDPATALATLKWAPACTSVFLEVATRLRGGKGGFGSMLRAQGGRMSSKKSTNFDACRDLSGRRLKTVKEAKKMTDALEKMADVEAKREEQIARKIEEGLNPKVLRKRTRFDDATYDKERTAMIDAVRNATEQSLAKAPMKKKAKISAPTTSDSSASSSSSPDSAIAKDVGVIPAKVSNPLSYWDEDLSSESEDDNANVASSSPAKSTKGSARSRKLVKV